MKYLLQLVEPVVISFQRSALLNIYLVTFRFALLGPKEAWKENWFPKPVFHGDTLHVRTKVIALRESRSRPEVGIVEFEHAAFNQNNDMVAICKRHAMMKRLPAK